MHMESSWPCPDSARCIPGRSRSAQFPALNRATQATARVQGKNLKCALGLRSFKLGSLKSFQQVCFELESGLCNSQLLAQTY
jgi:hypothetical protein